MPGQPDQLGGLDVGRDQPSQLRFTQKLIELRREHPILRRNLFLNGKVDPELGVRDLIWINARGDEMDLDSWKDSRTRCIGMLLDGRARPTGIQQSGREATLLLLINDHFEDVRFCLPSVPGGMVWKLILETNVEETSGGVFPAGEFYDVPSRSLLLLEMQAEAESV